LRIPKRIQYENLGIPEYWIIDPQEQTVLMLAHNDEGYAHWRLLPKSAILNMVFKRMHYRSG
jgi:Uma2 family endonuclease